ncbi:MAG: hypothetical protein KKF74_04090 [Nanoarchaeota archaeon]|nr:hypothetical protein [Nanoarchaeota archaeon]
MVKPKRSKPGPIKTISILFIIFFAILYFIFQPHDFSTLFIPLILGLSLAYLFGMWLVSQQA